MIEPPMRGQRRNRRRAVKHAHSSISLMRATRRRSGRQRRSHSSDVQVSDRLGEPVLPWRRSVTSPFCLLPSPLTRRGIHQPAKPHRPRLSVDGKKCAHCSRRIRFIRFDRRMTSPPHRTARLRDYAVAACSSRYLRIRRWSCVRDNPSRRAAFVLFPRHSCRTLAIVVRSSALRSVLSLRDGLGAWLQRQVARCRWARLRRESRPAPGHCAAL